MRDGRQAGNMAPPWRRAPRAILVCMATTCCLNIIAIKSRALAAALFIIGALAGANAAEPREESGFGSNPGNLRMFSYVPSGLAPSAPLIVVLHGCKQRAATFARDAGWLTLADKSKLALLLPEQKGLPSFFYDFYVFFWVGVG